MIALVAALAACVQDPGLRKESTYYYSNGFSPAWQLRNRPWQGIAVDSKGQVVVVHGQATGAGNKPMSGAQLRIFSPAGDEIAQYASPHHFYTNGLAVDEKAGRIYVASDFFHVRVFDWRGPGSPLVPALDGEGKPLAVARKDGGRCAGVSLGRDGTLFTADLGENRVYRFYPAGGHSSFGSGPGGGDQGFNNVRRVFESPASGTLIVLDMDGIRVFGRTGQYLKRIGPRIPEGGFVLAMGPDGKLLAGWGATLSLLDSEGGVLRELPIPADRILDAALGGDGKIYVIPRGEELCCAAYDAEGRLLWRRGADFDRLTVTLPSASLKAGAPLGAKVEFTNALRLELLDRTERKAAEGRPQNPPIRAFLRPAAGGAWSPLPEGWTLPAGLEGPHRLRLTPAGSPEGPGPAVEFPLTISTGMPKEGK